MFDIRYWLRTQSNNIPAPINRQLLCHILQKDSAWLLAHDDTLLSESQIHQLGLYQKQYLTGKPLAYITGYQAFWDLNLKVNEHTLIPRADTELIIEALQALAITPQRILDLGTGSGALALVLARLYPDSLVTATDISPEALSVASVNAQHNQVSNIEFIQSHWFNELATKQFDLIVSNPPYIEPDDCHLQALTHEPITALVAANKGLADLEIIISQAAEHLMENGILIVEHGYDQQQPVTKLFNCGHYTNIKTYLDIEQRPRATIGYLA